VPLVRGPLFVTLAARVVLPFDFELIFESAGENGAEMAAALLI